MQKKGENMIEQLPSNLENILTNGESTTVEFKETKIYEFICSSEGKTRQEINEYIYPKLTDEHMVKNNRVRTALTYLKNKEMIKNQGFDTKPLWSKKKFCRILCRKLKKL